jgi:hypothetical protein
MRKSPLCAIVGIALLVCARSGLAAEASVRIASPADGATLDAMAQAKIVYEVTPGPKVITSDDLLSGHRLIVLLLDLIAKECAAQRARDHRHIAPGAAADQTADAQPPEAANDRPDAAMMVALQLQRRDLLDYALANLHLPGLLAGRQPSGRMNANRLAKAYDDRRFSIALSPRVRLLSPSESRGCRGLPRQL